jgi:hypothetical protein
MSNLEKELQKKGVRNRETEKKTIGKKGVF